MLCIITINTFYQSEDSKKLAHTDDGKFDKLQTKSVSQSPILAQIDTAQLP